MKKNMTTAKNLLLGMVAATTVAMTSCTDDFDNIDAPKYEASNAASGSDPLGIGYNTITADVNSMASLMIPVNTSRINITNSNPNLEYQVINMDGKTYIKPAYHGTENGGETDIVSVSHMDSDAKKSLFLTVNPATIGTRAASNSTMEDKVLNTLAYGIIPGKAAPEVKAKQPAFSVAQMCYFEDKSGRKENYYSIEDSRYSGFFYRHAKNHNEHMRQEANSVGFDLSLPLGDWNFGFGMNYSSDKSTHTTQERESATYGLVERTAVGSINQTQLLNKLDAGYKDKNVLSEYVDQTAKAIMAVDGNYNFSTLSSDIRVALAYQKIMNQGLNNALNNPNSSSYLQYNEENLRNLIKEFGMYVSTTCQMGGMAQSTFSRNANSSEASIEWAIKMKATASNNLTVQQTEKSEKKDTTQGQVVTKVLNKTRAATDFKLTVEKGSKVQDILDAMEEQMESKSWGGTGSFEDCNWKLDANNPAEWVCISYSTPRDQQDGDWKSFSGEVAGSDLIPLWKLCLDPVRRAALRKLIEPDASNYNRIPYFNYNKGGKKHLVIADVKCKFYDIKTSEKNFLPFYANDCRATGSKKHLYVPLRNNQYGLGNNNSIVSFGQADILLYGDDTKDDYIIKTMVPFVAYEWVYEDDTNDYTGITSIRFGKVSGNETKCSSWTYDMIKRCSKYSPRNTQTLLLTYAQASTPIKDRIKAVGFQYTDKDKKNKVFASSIGTELHNDCYDTSAEYNKHWGNKDFINSNVPNGANIFDGFHRTWYGSNQPYDRKKNVFPCASTKDVETNVASIILESVKKR